MELTVMGKYRTLMIKPDAELDQYHADELRTEADRLIKKTGVKNVVFDMRRVTFMDSSGIGVIMGRYRTVSPLGGRVAVFGMDENVKRIFNMSGLGEIVAVADELRQAVDAVI